MPLTLDEIVSEVEIAVAHGRLEPNRGVVKEDRNCAICRRKFHVVQYPSDRKACPNQGTYCSNKCFSVSRKGKEHQKKCNFCSGVFTVPDYKIGRKYCTRTCADKARRGVKPWNFGTAFDRETKKGVKRQLEYRRWRNNVLSKNEGNCIKCGEVAKEAHHIYYLDFLIREHNIKNIEQAIATFELWDTNNGAPLCRKCHEACHSDMPYPQTWYKSKIEWRKTKEFYVEHFHLWSGLMHKKIDYHHFNLLDLYTPYDRNHHEYS